MVAINDNPYLGTTESGILNQVLGQLLLFPRHPYLISRNFIATIVVLQLSNLPLIIEPIPSQGT
jgi:hypothetical protein